VESLETVPREVGRHSKCEHRMLTMAEEFRSEAGFRISRIDPLGRTIEPGVLDAAEEIGQRHVPQRHTKQHWGRFGSPGTSKIAQDLRM